jgi:amidase
MASTFDPLTAGARDLQKWLHGGSLTSVDLVEAYLHQIQKHNDYLHAVISTVSREKLLRTTQFLHDERCARSIISPLYGMPVLLKVDLHSDNVSWWLT